MHDWLILANSVVILLTAIVVALNRKDVLAVKKATDGMKTELVAATAAMNLQAGEEVGRIKGEQKAAVLAQGVEQARLEAEKKVTIVTEVAVKEPKTKP